MNKKIISGSLALILGVGTFSFASQENVYANELHNSNVKYYSSNLNNVDFNEGIVNVLEDIENNYAIQNSDGTFSLSSEVYKKYDTEIVDYFKSCMNDINDYISKGKLSFELRKINNVNRVVNTKVNMTDSDLNGNINLRGMVGDVGKIVSNYSYCSNYEWHIWGFRADVNKTGSQLLVNEYTYLGALYGATFGIVSAIPGVGAIAAAAGVTVGVVTFGWLIKQASNGVAKGKCRVTGMGKPIAGDVFWITY